MAEAGITVSGISEICNALEALPNAIVASIYLDALTAGIEAIHGPLLLATPELPANESGGMADDPGALRAALDYKVELDSQGRGGRAGLGYGKQSQVANLVEYGHQLVTHKGKTIGSVVPYPFIRKTFDGPAPEAAITAFAEVLEEKLDAAVASVARS